MFTLIIDTSTDKALVAFAFGTKIILNFCLPAGVQSSRCLMSTIESGFQELKLSPAALERIGVGVGPGSFTGTRVGVSAAYGLAFPKKLPLIGFCSLEGFVCHEEGKYASIIDARSGGFYCQLLECRSERVIPLGSPRLIPKEQLTVELQGCPQVGPDSRYPDATHLACLIEEKYQKGLYSSHLDLIYLRAH